MSPREQLREAERLLITVVASGLYYDSDTKRVLEPMLEGMGFATRARWAALTVVGTGTMEAKRW